MDKLKTILFRRTLDALNDYVKAKKPPLCGDGALERAVFCTLFSVIDEAGLEEEYYEWKGDTYD